MCEYVCMYACMCIYNTCMFTHMHTYIRIYIYIWVCVCMHVWTCGCELVCLREKMWKREIIIYRTIAVKCTKTLPFITLVGTSTNNHSSGAV